jgi:hypothetical protein
MAEEPGAEAGGAREMQFEKVELATPAAARTCARCNQAIEHEYFEAAGHVLCRSCGKQLGGAQGRGPFLRAAAFGSAAALLGTIVWFAILKFSGREFGLLAIGVGLVVGLAVRKGSQGRGGRRYQALAMILTYVSITASYVPIVVKELGKHETASSKTEAHEAGDASAPHTAALAPGEPSQTSSSTRVGVAHAQASTTPGAGAILFALVFVLGVAMVSPFLSGFDNIMGLLIIGIALYEAWKINRGISVSGPFLLAQAQQGAAQAP